jgi:PAS domain S-box-containing protein
MLEIDTIASLFKASPTANMILYPDAPFFTIGSVNPSFLSIKGLESLDMIGLSIFDVFKDVCQDSSLNQNHSLRGALTDLLCLNSLTSLAVQQYRYSNEASGNKQIEYFTCSTCPLFDEEGNVAFIVLNFQEDAENATDKPSIIKALTEGAVNTKDMTSVANAQQKLDEQQDQLADYAKKVSNILESIPDAFFALDKNWTVTYWNKEAERILKLQRGAIQGLSLWDFYPEYENSALYLAYQKAMDENTSLHVEEYYAELNLWLEISAFPSDEGLSVYFKDITARKQQEAKLTEVKQQYEDLFQLSSLPQFVYGLEDLLVKDVNQAAIAYYGYSKADFLSMTIMDVSPPEDIPFIEKLLKEKLQQGLHHNGLFRHIKKTGEIIDVQVAGNPIVFEGESARLVLAVDVTEKLNAQKALQASEQRFKALIQDGSDIIGILDSAGDYLYVNQTADRVLGIAPEDFVGKNAFDFIHEQDKPRVIAEFEQLGHQKSIKISAFRFRNNEGHYRWIETIVTNMMDDPSVGGIVSNSRDVTERIENEMRIQQSIERYNIVSKATRDAIWDLDVSTGMVVAINGVFGYKETVYSNSWWKDQVHPADLERILKKIKHATKGKKNRLKLEYRFRCADGIYINVLDRGFLVYSDSGEHLRTIGSMEDVTERQLHIQTVEAQNQRLEEIAWAQSHLVRAPLTNIMGITKLLSYEVADNQALRELISHLSSSAEDLDSIIKDIIRNTETIHNIKAE